MESQQPEKIQFSFSIHNFKLEKFELNEELINDPKSSYDVDKLQYEFNINMNSNIDTEEILMILNINIFADEEKTQKIGLCDSSGMFKVKDLLSTMKNYDDKIPNVILATFMGILVSSARGMMIVKMQDTKLSGSMLPVVDPMAFFKNYSK